jgi:hypothetical protein
LPHINKYEAISSYYLVIESTAVESTLGVSTVVILVQVGASVEVDEQDANSIATAAKINRFFIFCFLMIFKLVNNI